MSYLSRSALCGLLVLASGHAVRAEYRLGAGDKLAVSVYGAPDLERRASISADGQIAIPLVGNITLAGLTIDQAKQRIQAMLAERQIVKTPDVSIDITEYRPFFIVGDVARPGSYPFQPGMTVRQAVALAGGYDLVRFHFGQNPFVQAADLRAEYQTLGTELAREKLRLARLQAEIDGKPEPDFGTFDEIGVPKATFDPLRDFERRLFKERAATQASERASLVRIADFSQNQVEALDSRIKGESQSVNQQLQEVDKIRSLSDKGIVTSTRALEEQRSADLARSRLLDTEAQAAQAHRTAEETRRAVQRFDETRRADLLKEITDATANIDRIKNRIASAAERFAIIGTASSAVLAAGGDRPEVSLFRKVNGATMPVTGDEDLAVEPGDVVQVTLKQSKLLGMATTR